MQQRSSNIQQYSKQAKYLISFLQQAIVLQETERDFNNKDYLKFDPSFGDDGCERRAVALLSMIYKNQPFAELSQEEKDYLILCHVLTKQKEIHYDAFNIEYTERAKPSQITYKKSKSNMLKFPGGEENIKYLSEELARLSVKFIRDISACYEDENLIIEGKAEHKIAIHGKIMAQMTTALGIDVLFKESLQYNHPIFFAIRRVEYQFMSSTFLYQGGDVLCYLPDDSKTNFRIASAQEIEQNLDKAGSVFECFAIKNPGAQNEFSGFAASLDGAQSFEEYKARFMENDLLHMCLTMGSKYDITLGRKAATEKFNALQEESKISVSYPMQYASNISAKCTKQQFLRATSNIPLCLTHVYVSTLRIQYQSMSEISMGLVDDKWCTRRDNMIQAQLGIGI